MTELVLHEAAVSGDSQQLESMLMIHRIDIDHKDEDYGDRNALHWAASRALSRLMTNLQLPDKAANKPLFNNSYDLLLHETCALGDDAKLEELASLIISGKIDVDSRDEEWGERTSMHWSALRGHVKCVKLLLEYGADPAARMVGGWTPAHCAAETGRLNVLKALIDHQAPVTLPDNSGDNPKRVAEIYGNTACVELLQSVETSAQQKQLLVRDKFRTNTRKISRILAEKTERAHNSAQRNVADSPKS